MKSGKRQEDDNAEDNFEDLPGYLTSEDFEDPLSLSE